MLELKNDLFLKAALGLPTERTPVWLMRQAGRILPEYKAVRSKFDGFKSFVKNPEAAAEVTIQPVDILGVDAAIIFSDILVIPEAMGCDYIMEEKRGPLFPKVIENEADILALTTNVESQLEYVISAIKITKKELHGRVPLIGFAGAPWTIFAYMTEGSGSKTFTKARAWLYQHPELSHLLLQKITDATILYLKAQVAAGVNLVQVFDSWAGILSPALHREFSQKYIAKICDALQPLVPVTVFGKGAFYAIKETSELNCNVIGIDWNMEPLEARKLTNGKTLQGNFDPCALFAPKDKIKALVHKMIDEFGTQNYIANLGHGVYPETNKEVVKYFVETVKEYSAQLASKNQFQTSSI